MKSVMVLQLGALREAYIEARDSGEAARSEADELRRKCESLQRQLRDATITSLKQVRAPGAIEH